MARDGNGDYSRPVTPPSNGEVADADDFNAEMDDSAQAHSDAINKNGTKAFAADQSLGGFKLTDLGAPTGDNDAARKVYVDSALSTAIGVTVQPYDATLTALAALAYGSEPGLVQLTAADTVSLTATSGFLQIAGAQTITGAKTFDDGGNSSDLLLIRGASPTLNIFEDDVSANSGYWRHQVANGGYVLQARTDANGFGANVLTIARSGTTIGDIDFSVGDLKSQSTAVRVAGKTAVPIPAAAMVPNTTNGAAAATSESSSNKVMTRTLDFDASTQEGAQFEIIMPKGWNEGTVTFQPVWTAASGSGGVVWELRAQAQSDDDALDGAWGTGQTSTDTLLATGDRHIGPESSAITIGGSPAEGDVVVFQIRRNVADGNDTLNADARLLGIRLNLTINGKNDA